MELRFNQIVYKKKKRFIVDPDGDFILSNDKIILDTNKLKLKKELDTLLKTNPLLKNRIKGISDLEKKIYYCKVWIITENNDLTTLKNHTKRSFKGYHLDHIFPISQGFKLNIPPEAIGNIKNLQFIPRKRNMKKRDDITETTTKLINDIITNLNN